MTCTNLPDELNVLKVAWIRDRIDHRGIDVYSILIYASAIRAICMC